MVGGLDRLRDDGRGLLGLGCHGPCQAAANEGDTGYEGHERGTRAAPRDAIGW